MTQNHNPELKQAAIRHIKALPITISLVVALIGLIVLIQDTQWKDRYICITIIIGMHWVFIMHLLLQIIDCRYLDFFGIPKVVKILQNDKIILVNKSPWLGVGIATTIYIVEDGVERILAIGEVINVQHNDMVQIALRFEDDDHEERAEIWKTLERAEKKSLLVKPGSYRGRL